MRKYAVIGCGNGGKAVAAEIASKGHSVSIFEKIPNDDFKKLQESKKLKLTGAIELEADLDLVTDDMAEAIADRDVILIVVPAFAHESLLRELLPLMLDGQDLVVIPGNYSTFIAKKIMKEASLETDITFSETVSLPYACRATDFNTVEIYKKKQQMKLGTAPSKDNKRIVDELNAALDIFEPAANVLEIALDNPNLVVHPLPTLLNIGGIEADPKGWRHYIDGISPSISEGVHALDDERMAIGEAYGIDLKNLLSFMKECYGVNSTESIYDYVNSDQSPYKEIFGQNVYGRYVTEDLPYLAVPAMQLAQKAGIAVPWLSVIIELGSLVHQKNYIEMGYNLDKLGIQELDKNSILELIS